MYFNSYFQAQKPKDITEVAESVDYNEDLDEAILRSAWAKAFIQSPALNHPQGGQVKRDLFIFLVSCCLLNKIRDSPKKVKNDGRVKTENNNDVKSEKLLEIIRSRFFADDKVILVSIMYPSDLPCPVDESVPISVIIAHHLATLSQSIILGEEIDIKTDIMPQHHLLHIVPHCPQQTHSVIVIQSLGLLHIAPYP